MARSQAHNRPFKAKQQRKVKVEANKIRLVLLLGYFKGERCQGRQAGGTQSEVNSAEPD